MGFLICCVGLDNCWAWPGCYTGQVLGFIMDVASFYRF